MPTASQRPAAAPSRRSLPWLLPLLLLALSPLLPLPAQAQPALGAGHAGVGSNPWVAEVELGVGLQLSASAPSVRQPNGEYRETHIDLRVNALGGPIDIARSWSQGRWWLNPAWAPLNFELDPLDGSVPAPPTQLGFGIVGRTHDPSSGAQSKLHNAWGAGRVGSLTDCLGTVSGSVQFLASSRQFKVVITSSRGQSKTFYYPAVYGSALDKGIGVSGASYAQDAQGHLLGQTHWDGRFTEKYRGPRGLITTHRYTYDWQPSEIIHADGAREAFEYESQRGLIEKYTDALGIQTHWKYDSRGLLIEQTEAAGTSEARKTTWQYDQWGQVTRQTLGEGQEAITWQYSYDADGNATQITDPVGDAWRLSYDLAGQVTAVTNPLGHTTRFEYDSQGNLTRRTSPSGHSSSTVYNSLGQPTQLKDELGRQSSITYNHQGQISSVTNALGHTARYTYNAFGNPTSETTPSGLSTTFEHDQHGRVIAYVDPWGNRVQFEHGNYGSEQAELLTAIVLPGGLRQEYQYDQRGRQTVATTRASDGQTLRQTTTYDAAGRIVGLSSAGGQSASGQYDALGRLIQVTDSLGNVTRATYNLLDQTTSITDASGNTTQYRYDKAGQLLEEIRPEGASTRYQYDAAGQLSAIAYPDGASIQYHYDPDGNPIRETRRSAAGAPEQTITYQYDASGDITGYTQQNASGQTISSARYQLDALGRVSEETITYGQGAQAISRTLKRQWDADFNTTALDINGQSQRYQYQQGRPSSIQTPQGQTIRISAYDWHYPTTIEYPGATRTQSYDSLWRPSGISVSNSAGHTLLDIRNSFNQESSISDQQIQQAGGIQGSIHYQYDRLDRLTQAQPSQSLKDLGLPDEHYSYDASHNRTASAHQGGAWRYESGNRLGSWGQPDNPTRYQYNASGHIASAEHNGATRHYHYDASQRLSHITQNGQTIARYQYDPAGRRISKTTGQGAQQTTTWYLYSDEGLVEEINAAGQTTKSYGWQADSGWGTAPLWQTEHNSGAQGQAQTQTHWLHTDHLERPLVASDSSGAATWQALAESFGQTWVNSTSRTEVNIRLPGQYWDAESGRHYNQQRYYDPQTGRYMQSDPLGLYDGINTYGYAYQNPLSYSDPTGEAVPAIVWSYARCVAKCKVSDALRAAIQSECDPRTLGDCALECLNPLRWLKIDKLGVNKIPRYQGPKPKYHVNQAHVRLRRANDKTPLPADAEDVYKRAVPGDPVNPKHWYGLNNKGDVYRFSSGNDGTAHFSGSNNISPGFRVPPYARDRLGLKR
ncbi:RHS repeat domain-containing protein [Vandammella animalimorsus]|uniref:Teneurin-like YD-shell domain-containing protein n=1 Tax=Vandammella animalimorsus TaxID=2029117 RepID=A0A2A2AZQ6_9BURK|nr:RHS repeat domain-containing protein [Vandammella animalimorsus]PAT43139.1 hypothetical protein CK621_06320 [Vandammella animalimorsus]